MRTHLFEIRQSFTTLREELFPFFADARNLERITPPWLHFEVLTPPPIEMERGALIDYRLRWRVLPIRWRTEITAWQPPYRFVDEQKRGPYRLWRHEHLFVEDRETTTMTDRVEYAVPGGRLVQRFFVKPDVERIFAHRRQVLSSLFPVPSAS
jgi:ligand-binding SRPBCC domain-containing protein